MVVGSADTIGSHISHTTWWDRALVSSASTEAPGAGDRGVEWFAKWAQHPGGHPHGHPMHTRKMEIKQKVLQQVGDQGATGGRGRRSNR